MNTWIHSCECWKTYPIWLACIWLILAKEVRIIINQLLLQIRKFKKKVQEAGIIQELRERQHFVKPSEKRKKAKAAGRARWLKKQAKQKADWGN